MIYKIDWKWTIGILAALIPFIYTSNFFQKDKELSYEVLQIINKSSIDGIENNNDIVFGFKDGNNTYLTDNLSIITIKFINSGKNTILRSDFDTPLTIIFPKDVKYLQSQISFVQPKDLQIKPKFIDNSIQLEPMLLNPDDEFTISIILDGAIQDITPTSRIIGISELTKIDHENKEKNKIYFIIGIFLLIYLAIYLEHVITHYSGTILFHVPALIVLEFTALSLTTENMIFDISKGYSYTIAGLILLISYTLAVIKNFSIAGSSK